MQGTLHLARVLRLTFVAIALFAPVRLMAQVDTMLVDTCWTRFFSPDDYYDIFSNIAFQPSGNGDVIVSGLCHHEHSSVIARYDAQGNQKWLSVYDTSACDPDRLEALAVDRLGNSYVAGYSPWGSGRSEDAMLAKYDSNGVRKWVRAYSGGDFNDRFTDVAVDPLGNVIAVG